MLGGYGIHERHAAQNLAADNVQTTAALNATQHQLSDLTAKVNQLATRNETPAPESTAQIATGHTSAGRPAATRQQREDPRYKKLQSQLDAQGKAIQQAQTDLASTQGNLDSTWTELTGSIVHTHDELVVLQKRGERNYTEFDLSKSKQFKREGPFELRLKNDKHQYADMELMVDDRNLSQKHVNLYQPVMFYTPDSPQPVEVVINEIGKDHLVRVRERFEVSPVGTRLDGERHGQRYGKLGSGNHGHQHLKPSPRQKLPMPQ